MIENAENCKKKTSRYDSANLFHASVVKPKLKNIQPYEFEFLDPNSKNVFKGIQNGNLYGNQSQDHVIGQILYVLLTRLQN